MKTNNTLKILFVLALAIFTTNTSFAQNENFKRGNYTRQNPTEKQRPNKQRPMHQIPDSAQIVKMVNELSKSLSLNTKQREDILNLHLTHFEESKASAEKQRKVMEQNRIEFEESIKKLLTKEQQIKFTEFLKNHKPNNRKPNKK